jgi:hypothetical protein
LNEQYWNKEMPEQEGADTSGIDTRRAGKELYQ